MMKLPAMMWSIRLTVIVIPFLEAVANAEVNVA